MKILTSLAAICFAASLSGCVTKAVITQPDTPKVQSPKFQGKAFHAEVFYSQPRPSDSKVGQPGEMQPLAPVNSVEKTRSAHASLTRLGRAINAQLPASIAAGNATKHDLKLVMELTAKSVRGPVYTHEQRAANFAKAVLTLSAGADDYVLVADFGLGLKLVDATGKEVAAKSYTVYEAVPSQRDPFSDGFGGNDPTAGDLFEKHIRKSIHDFFSEAAK